MMRTGSRNPGPIGTVLGIAFLAVLVLGPPAWIIYTVLQGGPLFEYGVETVTVQRPYVGGVLPGVLSALLVWVVVYLALFVMPRYMRA